MTYSKAALKKMIDQMHAASDQFYEAAIQIHNHPFIEFTGFINEYIKICETAMSARVDFTETSAHSEIALPMEAYNAAYLGEKFDCIFGPSFRAKPALKRAFDNWMWRKPGQHP